MKRTISAVVLSLAVASAAGAQAKADDAFARAMFDPQFVLKHAQAIALTPTQRRGILDELKSAQTALAPLQVDMAEPALELVELLESTRIDESKAMAKIDQVLKIENEVKKRQAVFVIRVKNLLTAEQQSKLRSLRDAEAKGGGGAPEPNAPPPPAP